MSSCSFTLRSIMVYISECFFFIFAYSSCALSVEAGWRVVPGAACGSGHGGVECAQAVR